MQLEVDDVDLTVDETDSTVSIVAKIPGPDYRAACSLMLAGVKVTVSLETELGDRTLLDGSYDPPRPPELQKVP